MDWVESRVFLPPILLLSRNRQWLQLLVLGSPPVFGSLIDLLWRCLSAAKESGKGMNIRVMGGDEMRWY